MIRVLQIDGDVGWGGLEARIKMKCGGLQHDTGKIHMGPESCGITYDVLQFRHLQGQGTVDVAMASARDVVHDVLTA